MASLNNLYIKLDTLETLVKTLKAKNQSGVQLTISVNDEANQYGQNISAYVSQSKEESDAKKQKFYVGNGNTFWAKGETKVFKKESKPQQQQQNNVPESDGLPF